MGLENLAADYTVTRENAPQQITQRMSELADLLAEFGNAGIEERAWSELLIFAPPKFQPRE